VSWLALLYIRLNLVGVGISFIGLGRIMLD